MDKHLLGCLFPGLAYSHSLMTQVATGQFTLSVNAPLTDGAVFGQLLPEQTPGQGSAC